MATLPVPVRPLIALGGLAVAIAAPIAAIVVVSPAEPIYVAQCGGGDDPDPFTFACVPFMTPKTSNTSATAASADDSAACPAGVTGAECVTRGTASDTGNPEAGRAAEAAAETEQIGEDVGEAEGGLGAP